MDGGSPHSHGGIGRFNCVFHCAARSPQNIDHCGRFDGQLGASQWKATDGSQMVFELTHSACILCVVSSVVWSGCHFVEQHRSILGDKHFDTKHSTGTIPQGINRLDGNLFAFLTHRFGHISGWSEHNSADGILLNRIHSWVRRRCCSVGGSNDHDGNFAIKIDPSFDVNIQVNCSCVFDTEFLQGLFNICGLGRLEHSIASAVVAAPTGLEHERDAQFFSGLANVCRRGSRQEAWKWYLTTGKVGLLSKLILNNAHDTRTWLHVDTTLFQFLQSLHANVFNFDRHNVGAHGGQFLDFCHILEPSLNDAIRGNHFSGRGGGSPAIQKAHFNIQSRSLQCHHATKLPTSHARDANWFVS
mmetsp:Transcript_15077/g.32937  ORF Transcript_15077/g.32937 Transcript_15077/m.32937 type:complete len:358 (-) Transcript_15077:91-1164(-)